MNNETFCIYPFTSLALKHFNNKGALEAFWPCCMMGDPVEGEQNTNRLEIENAQDMTPEEMFNHPRMQLLRDNLLNGVKDTACSVCWKKEEKGIRSFREISIDGLTKEKKAQAVKNPRIQEIDISISNQCNLRCRMCAPSLSNSLGIDHDYFKKNDMLNEVIEVTGWWNTVSYTYRIDESDTWRWLLDNTKQLSTVKMSGGEPFFNKHVINFIDKCIEDGTSKTLDLTFRTNGTKFNDELMEKLVKFKSNSHDISVDGYGKSYEYIRYPAKFEDLDNSLKLYKKYIKKPMRLIYIVSIHNVMDIPEFVKWAMSIDNRVELLFTKIYSSERGVALSQLSTKLLNKAKEQLLPFIDSPVKNSISTVIAQIDDAILNNRENRELTLRETLIFDKSRNQTFEDYLHKDIVSWLKNE